MLLLWCHGAILLLLTNHGRYQTRATTHTHVLPTRNQAMPTPLRYMPIACSTSAHHAAYMGQLAHTFSPGDHTLNKVHYHSVA